MAQFVTHIQPTLLEASQGHVPNHHAHQVGVQHPSHLPHSGHNMPSPPTSHNHQHPMHYQQFLAQHQHHANQDHHTHSSHPQSPPSQLTSPSGTTQHHQQHQQQQHHHHHHHYQHQQQLAGGGSGGGGGGGGGGSGKQHGDKHEHCPTGHQSSGDGNTSFLRAARAGNLERVLEHLKNNIDINTSNANGLNALHLASKDGHIQVVSELLRRGAIVDSATKKGNTALHIASLAGQEEVVKLLLQHNASVNVQSQNGFTPLYMAAQENHDSVVKLLLANGANQSLATEDGFTPLAVAMQQGHDKVVAVLLESDTRGKVRLPALHIAAKKDDVKAATLLLDNDHNPDITSKSGFTPLHIASHYGNQNIANLLIQKGADVNYSAKHNISPLHVAAKWGKTNLVSLLLEKGANIEAKTRDGLTPLHCAARSGHEQVVDMLLERGAPISAKTKNGLAPLHMAAQGEHVDAARILLYHRAPVDEVTVDYLTALHVAAHCGHVRVAKLLLDRNADANARALNGFTPLHIACKKNRIKVVELLLRHGASISATTESGLTPLHVAAFMGCMNIVIYLLQHDASPDVPTVRGETPLHLAARANQTDIIRILLRNGAQVDARAREQQTPLHIASRLGNVDIVMLLLQHGAQVDATTKDMYTALHIAAKEGQDEVAAVLIENGAALDAATKKGFTPLHLTAKYGHIKVAQLLLQKEADVDAQGKNGVTPLHVACHYDNQNVALLLLEKGASPHATAKNGHTPLHIAARKNQMDIATTLLEYGAQANAESKAGFTPLHLSSQEGHAEISNLLIEHKAGVNHPARNGLTPMHLCAQEDNVNVAEILQRNGANIDMATKAGYTPLHVAAHFGQANMVRFLLQHGANVDAATAIGYTPLHQTAQQGHCHIVNLLLEHKANANAQTVNGQTPLHIARKLGYISVLDSLKSITKEDENAAQAQSDEKYRVVAPEAMHESFMSDSEEEGGDTNDWDACYGIKGDRHMTDSHVYLPYYSYHGEKLILSSEDNMLSDQPYRYLTVDEMKSLGDDSLPIDVTRDERERDSNRMVQSAEYGTGVASHPPPITEEIISPHKAQVHGAGKTVVDGVFIPNGIHDEPPHVGRKLTWKSFLVSFLVDARGGAMRGCRHSGVRMIIPSRSTCQPTRVTCRYVKPQRTMHPPQLMEGEALASRVLELGPVSTKFIGPVVMEVPHFASLRGKEREIIILRSDNGETWREHTIDNSEEIIHDVLQQCFEPEEIAQLDEQAGNHVCRFVTYDFPQYFAVVSRIRQEVHAIGPEGGMVSSTVVPQVQAVFPQGALTKKIKVGLQAQPVDADLTAKLLGRGVAVSPIVTVEPRRRKFHKAITLSMPAPKAHSQGMINQYSGNTPTLRLLCSITGGPSRAQWEDVTGSTPLTFVNDCVSFTTTVSARFWLMDCRNISEATKMATELYKEVIHVPFMAKFVVFAKKIEPYEARLRVFCMTDDREDKTLEKMELFTEVAKSRNVEVLEGKPQYIEMAGNLVPVTKSGDQLQLPFKAFRENRLPFTVRVKDQHADIVGRTLFMREPKVAKGEPPQHPICILNIVLPETVIPDSTTAFSDKISTTYRSSLFSLSKHQNDHYIGDIRIVDLSNLLGKDWIQLAPEIGISIEEIDEIINQHTDSIARQAQSMIRLYKDKPNYDILALEMALKNIGRDDIMKKCKSGRLSHSRDFDEADIMKNSESVEELVRQESKRIQQIHEREEIKYSAEEKEIEESESDEELTKRTVAERRDKIVKRLSIERQIPASSQKKEITREITEIKRKSLIEDKKAIHESEIMMQLPADNIIKSSTVPDQVIKMKMGKMDSTEISKTDFDKELTHKFKTSSRSSEEEDEIKHIDEIDKQDSRKIVEDIISAEKITKTKITPTEESVKVTVHTQESVYFPDETITVEKQVEISEKTEKSSQKVESIISAFETTKVETFDTLSKAKGEIKTDTVNVAETIKILSETPKKPEETKTFEKLESTKVEEKIADFEAKKVTYDFKGTEPKITMPKPQIPIADDTKDVTTDSIRLTQDFLNMEQKTQLSQKPMSQKVTEEVKQTVTTTVAQAPKAVAEVEDQEQPIQEMSPTSVRKLTTGFLSMEQQTQLPSEPHAEHFITDDLIKATTSIMTKVPSVKSEVHVQDTEVKQINLKEDFKRTDSAFTESIESRTKSFEGEETLEEFLHEDNISVAEALAASTADAIISVPPVDSLIAEAISEREAQARKITQDFISMEQKTQLPSMPAVSAKPIEEVKETLEEIWKEDITATELLAASTTDIMTSVPSSKPWSTEPKAESLIKEKVHELVEKVEHAVHFAEENKSIDEVTTKEAKKVVKPQETVIRKDTIEEVTVDTKKPVEAKILVTDDVKVTQDFLSMEQRTQLPSGKKPFMETKESLEEMLQEDIHAAEFLAAATTDIMATIPKAIGEQSFTELAETSEQKAKAELQKTYKAVEEASQEMADKLKEQLPELNAIKITDDFLSMEQRTQLPSTKKSFEEAQESLDEILKENVHATEFLAASTTDIMTSVPKKVGEQSLIELAEKAEKETKAELTETYKAVEQVAKEMGEKLKEHSPKLDVIKFTDDFLAMEQSTQLPAVKKEAKEEEEEIGEEEEEEVKEKIEKYEEKLEEMLEDDLRAAEYLKSAAKEMMTETSKTHADETLIDVAGVEGKKDQHTKSLDEVVTERMEEMLEEDIRAAEFLKTAASEIKTITKTHTVDHEAPKSVTEIIGKKVDVDVETEARKLTADFLSMEQTTQLEPKPAAVDDVMRSSTYTKITTLPIDEKITEIKKVEEISQQIPQKSEEPAKSMPIAADREKKLALDAIKLTDDFLAMEQLTQLPAARKPFEEVKETLTEVLHKDLHATEFLAAATTGIMTTLPKQVDEESLIDLAEISETKAAMQLDEAYKTAEQASKEMLRKLEDEIAPSLDAIRMTSDFLATEQSTQLPSTILTGDGLVAPLPVIEPRKSLTDAEFCKSVQDTITKKMSEGLIEITDEIKKKASDIPHSQTPPPTPIETKTEKQAVETSSDNIEESDYLVDTVTTLHKTTESTFERVTAISTIVD